ncbi:serine/threonine-protein kinase [Microbispora sp. ZYX-F-249]|uniref:Serine/threonine-protein kinase n=1 Tax=Microbispora maris TaxID=3144104 RepID=A0ABV0AKB0_9ACTN
MTAPSALRGGDPTFIGPYRIVRRLGAGGQGIVYLGTDGAGAPVAVKVLRPEIAADETTRSRFAREVAVAQRVASFCTAQFLAADLWSDPPYIVTEYVDGPSLQEEVARNGPRTGAALHRLAVGTATALTAIHEAGLVHRDFKPGNVLLGADGPRVIDFGIARALDATATVSSQVVGTPAYMAPEQIKAAEVGPAADVFAWGAVITFAATGRSPFAADTTHAVLYRVIDGEPDIAGVPEPLRALVARCLAKEPAQRPAMREVLMRLLGSADSADRETGPGSRAVDRETGPGARAAAPAVRRRFGKAVYAAVAAAAVLALGGGAALWLTNGAGSPAGGTGSGGTTGGRATTVARTTSSPRASTPPRLPPTLAGVWEGVLTQSNGKNWPMTVVIKPGARALVSYPSLGCAGVLTVTRKDADGQFILRETILKGTRCTRQGRLTLQAGDGKILLTYFPNGSVGGMSYSATATLLRKGV